MKVTQRLKLKSHSHSLTVQLYLTSYSARAARDLSKIRKYNVATNRVNYLQSISFGK